MREREVTEISPQRIGGDIRDDDLFAPEDGRAAGADVWADDHSINGAIEFIPQARSRAMPEVHAIRVEQQHGADHVRRLRFQQTQQIAERFRQWHSQRDLLQDLFLSVDERFGLLAFGDVHRRADELSDVAVRIAQRSNHEINGDESIVGDLKLCVIADDFATSRSRQCVPQFGLSDRRIAPKIGFIATLTEHVLTAETSGFQRCAIHFQDDPVQRQQTDERKHAVENGLPTLVAFRQRSLGPLVIGGVVDQRENAVLAIDGDAFERSLRMPDAAVVTPKVDLPIVDRTKFFQRLDQIETVLRVEPVVQVQRGAAQHIVALVTDDLEKSLVDIEKNAILDRRDADADGTGAEDRGKSILAGP